MESIAITDMNIKLKYSQYVEFYYKVGLWTDDRTKYVQTILVLNGIWVKEFHYVS